MINELLMEKLMGLIERGRITTGQIKATEYKQEAEKRKAAALAKRDAARKK